MAVEPMLIDKPFIMLCEGKADNQFFMHLFRHHRIPMANFPFPPTEGVRERTDDGGPLYGGDGFVNMLTVLRRHFRFRPESIGTVKGILIAKDATDNPGESFLSVQKQIEAAGEFGVPDRTLVCSRETNGLPPVVAMLVPRDNLGSLESLCVSALEAAHAEEAQCLEGFLDCCRTGPNSWRNTEKRDKARVQCLIAVTYRSNPTRSLSLAFQRYNGHAPAIAVSAPIFDSVAADVKTFCRAVGIEIGEPA